jgi:hypothetical protein
MNRRTWIAAALAGLGLALPLRLSASGKAELGSPAPPFRVRDTQNREWQLADFAGKPVILEWTSSSCPFVRAQYQSGVMQELQRTASEQGAVWLSVLSTHPSRGDFVPAEKAEAFHRHRGAGSTALLMDSEGTMGRAYGAAVTPHIFIVDGKGTLVYAGGPSDQPTMDPKEVRASRNYIRAALDDLRAGRPIATPASAPFGCAISYRG